jgi:methylglutaconyl-CoA hydratase
MAALLITHDAPVAHVRLNRPEVRNAFNADLIADLTTWARTIDRDSTRIAVLSGEGKVFCAGADLGWMAKTVEYSHEENLRDAKALGEMFEVLNTLPIPLVGRIHGAALGGGAGLAAVCDIVVAADDAVFGFTEAKLGILPAVISPYVVAKVGQSAARELFLTAARFSPARAREIGLVHAVVPASDLDAAIDAIVQELISSGPEAIAAAKALIEAVAGHPPGDVADLTSAAIARQRVSPEGQEGMRAFLDKKKPSWSGPS